MEHIGTYLKLMLIRPLVYALGTALKPTQEPATLKTGCIVLPAFFKMQRILSVQLVGNWGPKTDADAAFTKQSKSIAAELGSFDSRNEGNIITLVPEA